MGMKVALTDQINRISCALDTNPFLGKIERKELLLELEDLVQKRSRLDEVFKTLRTLAIEEEERVKKAEEENATDSIREYRR